MRGEEFFVESVLAINPVRSACERQVGLLQEPSGLYFSQSDFIVHVPQIISNENQGLRKNQPGFEMSDAAELGHDLF